MMRVRPSDTMSSKGIDACIDTGEPVLTPPVPEEGTEPGTCIVYKFFHVARGKKVDWSGRISLFLD